MPLQNLTHQENEDLARVGKGTPMGELLREYWHPALRSARLEADGAPVRVRLLGENFVAFRATDGQVGFFAEGCPHRGASLALAHNSSNGLRCIFHGWKIDVSGKVRQVPTEPKACEKAFADSVNVRHYPVREAGGLVWVYLRRDKTPPEFPEFEFNTLPPEHVDIRIGQFHCNWVQGMEAVIDSAHLGQLHRSSFRETFFRGDQEARDRQVDLLISAPSPSFELLETPFGFREAAIRELEGGIRQANLRQFAAPYYSFLPSSTETDRVVCVSVPNDDEWSSQYFITFNADRPLRKEDLEQQWRYSDPNPDNFSGDLGDVGTLWGQDRASMKAGHASGFPGRHSFHEDFILQESMGPITDRTQENLGTSDTVIVFTRRRLLQTAYEFRDGKGVTWGQHSAGDFDYGRIRGTRRWLEDGEDWTLVDPFAPAPPDPIFAGKITVAPPENSGRVVQPAEGR